MAQFQLLPDVFVPTFAMVVNYVPLPPPIARLVLDVTVSESLDPPGQFTFRINDPELLLIDPLAGLFTEGSRVEISLGYVGNTKKLITGEISALTADFPESGPATVRVDGFDLLHRGTRGTAYRTFEGPTPGTALPADQIVAEIAGELRLAPIVDPTRVPTRPEVQNHRSNLDFLKGLARAHGFFLWAEGDSLFFKRERPATSALQLEWGKTLRSFSIRLSTAGQVNEVEVRGWDPVQKQSFAARSTRAAGGLAATGERQLAQGSGGSSERVMPDTSVSSAQEAQAYADALLAEQRQIRIRGSGTSVGDPNLRVGTRLTLLGIKRFEGTYKVEQVTHSLSGGGYQTSFQVRTL